jgi:hypothetical protein
MRYGSPSVHLSRLRSDFAPQQLAYSARTDDDDILLTKVAVNNGQGRLIEYHDLIVFEFILRFVSLGRFLRHRMPHVACVDALLT